MSAHLSPAEIVALRDGEPLSGDRAEHPGGCDPCAVALDAARFRARRVEAALPPGPPLEREAVERARRAVRARLGESAPGARRRPVGGARRGLVSLSRAAGLLLLLAGGAAALPGSPVRGWIEAALEGPPAAAEAPATEEATPAVAAPAETGIRLRVDGGPVEVSVTGLQAGARVEVVRGGGNELEVVAPDGSRFSSADGRVEVTASGGPVRVTLPATSGSATVREGGRLLLRWTGEGREILAPVVATVGERLVFEAAGG